MRVFSAEDIDRSLDFPSLVDALSEAMRGGFIAPARHHHEIERAGEKPAIQLLMPAWTESASRAGLYLGAKIVNVFPGNSARGLPTVMGTYVLQSGRTGATLAALDGTRLTHWRTAAASALAARYLARTDAERLLVVGAGALAPYLARAHASQRSYKAIAVWNRAHEGAPTFGRTGSPTASSTPTTPSSTPPARPGRSSPRSLTPSPQSGCEAGRTSVSRYDPWYNTKRRR